MLRFLQQSYYNPGPNICITLYQPTKPRPSHYQPSPTSSLFCAQATTSSLLCSGSNICSILHEACHAQTPTYQAPTSCLLWPGPNMFLPTSCLLCSGPYIITPVLHRACHALVPTANRLYLCPNICFYPTSACYTQAPTVSPQSYITCYVPRLLHQACYAQAPADAPSYIKLVMLKPLHTSSRFLHQACYAQAPTHVALLHEACYAQAPTSAP